jgi:UDP-GlcNAc:undecaprenyl-phosphate GlcNAc-1-phosphate transferase
MTIVLFALMALALATVMTPVLRALAIRAGLVAHPSHDRWHRTAIPLAGGLAIVGVSMGVPLAAGETSGLTALVACSLAMAALGLADDVWKFRPALKLGGQLAIAIAFIVWAPQLDLTGVPVVDATIALAWIVGITNAFNLLDNVDGLAAGVAAIAGLSYLGVLWHIGPAPLVMFVAAFVGATLGFVIYNFQPASIFMGDSGSLFLGFFLAAVGLLAVPNQGAGAMAIPVLILLVPVFDTTFVTLTRVMAGRSPIAGGRDHTSHRLIALGIDERRSVLVHYGLTAAGGLVAFGVGRMDTGYVGIGLGLYAIALAALGIVLGHVEGAHAQSDTAPARLVLSEISYRNRALEVLLDAALAGLAYYAAYTIRFQGKDFAHFLPYFGRSLPLILICQVAGLWMTGKYRQVWRSFGAAELTTILRGVAVGVAASVIVVLFLFRFEGFSRIVFLVDGLVLTALLIGARVAVNRLDDYLLRQRSLNRQVLVYGAGRRGAFLVRDLLPDPQFNLAAIGFMDDDPAKRRLRIEGLRVLGGISELEAVLARYKPNEVIVSTERIDDARLSVIEASCRGRNVHLRRLNLGLEELRGPGMASIARHG